MNAYITNHFEGYLLTSKRRASLAITILPNEAVWIVRVRGQVQVTASTARAAIEQIATKWNLTIAHAKGFVDIETL